MAGSQHLGNGLHWGAAAGAPLGNDDGTFVFMGRCPGGEVDRLLSYESEANGFKQSFYGYEGLAGQGIVKTKTAPRLMVTRICRVVAEIVGDEFALPKRCACQRVRCAMKDSTLLMSMGLYMTSMLCRLNNSRCWGEVSAVTMQAGMSWLNSSRNF